MENFIQSFSPDDEDHSQNVDLIPFLSELPDLSTIVLGTATLQSLAFIAGYSVHQYLKRAHNCEFYRVLLTIDQDIIFDTSTFKLIEIMNRGGLKWPSEIALHLVVLVWKVFISIGRNQQIWKLFVVGRCRNVLVQLSKNILGSTDGDHWRDTCSQCNTEGWDIAHKLIFVTSNCVISNKVKNYNSEICAKAREDPRKLKKFKS